MTMRLLSAALALIIGLLSGSREVGAEADYYQGRVGSSTSGTCSTLGGVLSGTCLSALFSNGTTVNPPLQGGTGVPNTGTLTLYGGSTALQAQASVAIPIVCDGTTDNQPAIQAAINALEATSPPGGVLQLPACNNIAVANTILINSSGIFIKGIGGSGSVSPPISISSYCGTVIGTTVLCWTGSADGTVVQFDPANGGPSIKGGGLMDMVISGRTIAAIGVDRRSSQGQFFQNLTIENTRTTGFNHNVTGNTLQASEVYDVQGGNYINVNIQQDSTAPVVAAASCVVLDGSTTADTSFNTFTSIFCRHQNGDGIVCKGADSNNFVTSMFFNPGGSTGYDINLFGSNNSGQVCRHNKFGGFFPSANSNGVFVQGILSVTNGALGNQMGYYGLPATNSALTLQAPIQEWNGVEQPGLSYCNYNGLCNFGSITDRSLLINGSMAINQRHEGASQLLTSSSSQGLYPLDRWHLQSASASDKITGQQVAAGPFGATSKSLLLTTTVALSPAAANLSQICQDIEGDNIAFLGFGTSSAKNLTLGFWFQSSLTGNFSVSVGQRASNFALRRYLISFKVPVAATWYYYRFSIPGDTAGSWDLTTNSGMSVCFDTGTGVNFQNASAASSTATGTWTASAAEHTGDVQLVATQSATMNIAMVRLLPHSADLPWKPRPFGEELLLSQRYFAKTFLIGTTAPAQNAGIAGSVCTKNPIALGDPSVTWGFPVVQRIAPTITTFNPSATNANFRDVTAAADATVSVDPGSSTPTTGTLLATSGTVTTLGDVLCIQATADSDYVN